MKASSGNFSTVIASDSFKMFDIMTITLVDGTVLRLSNADVPIVWVADMAGGGLLTHQFIGPSGSQ